MGYNVHTNYRGNLSTFATIIQLTRMIYRCGVRTSKPWDPPEYIRMGDTIIMVKPYFVLKVCVTLSKSEYNTAKILLNIPIAIHTGIWHNLLINVMSPAPFMQ